MSSEFNRHALAPGVNLYIRATPKFKTTNIYVYMYQAMTPATVTRGALLPMVLGRGSAAYPTTIDLTRHLDSLYGAELAADVVRKGEVQCMVFRLSLANQRYIPGEDGLLARALATLAGIITRPALAEGAFRRDYFAQEAANLREWIAGLINDKRRYALQRCTEAMCPDEPFRLYRLGQVEDIDALSPSALFSYYQELLAGAPMDIFVMGNVEAAEVIDLVQRHFVLPAAPARPMPRTTPGPAVTGVRRVHEALDVQQGVLVVGLRTGATVADDGYIPMVVANAVLGSYGHSKLFQNVREKASLAYFAYSALEAHKGVGYMIAGIDAAKYEQALQICLQQLQELAAGQISDVEMRSTVNSLISDVDAGQDHPGQLVDLYADGLVAGRLISTADRIAAFRQVSPEQVAAAARRFTVDTVYFLTRKDAAPPGGGSLPLPERGG